MQTKSMAGDFEITVERFEVEDGQLIMVGRLGVWDARTHIAPREVLSILGKLFSPRVLLYMLRVPFLALQAPSPKPKTE